MSDIVASTLPQHTASVRRAVAAIPHDVRAEWRTKYLFDDGGELRAMAVMERCEASRRAEGKEATVRSTWMALADRAGVTGDPDTKAAAALAGLAMGLTIA
jgi:hypothetical protein